MTDSPSKPTAPATEAKKPSEPKAERRETTVQTAAGGTVQLEPKPEDYPASARMTPAAQQVNSALSQVVGEPAPPPQSSNDATSDVSDALNEGHAAIEARRADGHESAQKIADLKREIDDRKAA